MRYPPFLASSNIALLRADSKPPVELVVDDLAVFLSMRMKKLVRSILHVILQMLRPVVLRELNLHSVESTCIRMIIRKLEAKLWFRESLKLTKKMDTFIVS